LKRQQDRLAAKQAETEPVQITQEALPTAAEDVPPVPAPPLAEAGSSDQRVAEPQQPPEARADERQAAGSAKVGAKGRPRRSRQRKDRSPAGDTGDVPATVERLDPTAEAQDPEPEVPAATPDDDPAETIAEPKPTRKRRQASRASRPRPRADRQEDQLSVEQVDAPSVDAAQPSEAPSLFSERVAEYTLAHQRDRRSGPDRRSGIDRREAQVKGFEGPSDRRAGAERRSGRNRRRVTA
jgi:hypothetical protein